jgi:hypothetical protein
MTLADGWKNLYGVAKLQRAKSSDKRQKSVATVPEATDSGQAQVLIYTSGPGDGTNFRVSKTSLRSTRELERRSKLRCKVARSTD